MSTIEDLLSKLALTTVTTVSRIALNHATNAAIRNVTSYITTQLPNNKPDSKEIRVLQRQLDLKIKNLKVKPTLDIVARSVADGNTDLEPALEMCNDLKTEMESFASQNMTDPEQVKRQLRRLLQEVDDTIPSLHLSLRSIENRAGKPNLSPARLMQASHILTDQRDDYVLDVRLYSLFSSNQRAATVEGFTWKEEFHKAVLKISHDKEYGYTVSIAESLDDGLYHDEGSKGRKLGLELEKIKRMYYTQSGELLNIEDAKSPVLVMKLAKERTEDTEEVVEVKEATPKIIKEELQAFDWYAVELWNNGQVDDNDDDDDEDDDDEDNKVEQTETSQDKAQQGGKNNVASSKPMQPQNLLLLETVIKLALLETTEQMSHLEASDDLLTLYMQ
ncbi:RanGTP-binding protein-domain-containing protein [Blakeslea trispora]|nr:RanGTP-binding protein-domain-containing protein [Blakeslea trispora]